MNEITRVAPAEDFGSTLMKLLTDPKIPSDKLQIMLQMQRELIAERRKEAFQTAFVRMHHAMPRVTKHGTVELVTKDGTRLGSYKFAKWEDMDKAIRPVLNDYGFGLSFQQVDSDKPNHVKVVGVLLHADGHSIESMQSWPYDTGPGRNLLQAMGSALSYAKRYCAEGLCNIVREGQDDDGIAAYQRTVTEEQAAHLSRLLDETRTTAEMFLEMMVTGAKEIENVPQREYPRLVNALNEKRKKQKEKK